MDKHTFYSEFSATFSARLNRDIAVVKLKKQKNIRGCVAYAPIKADPNPSTPSTDEQMLSVSQREKVKLETCQALGVYTPRSHSERTDRQVLLPATERFSTITAKVDQRP